MTTLPSLFTDEIYIKGKPLEVENINNVTNNVTTINAVISGLTGGRPIADIKPEPLVQTRNPTAQDDMNENWNIGDIWVMPEIAYICMDNSELSAIWQVASLEARDNQVALDSTYSSNKIEAEHKHMNEQMDYKLSLKANTADVNSLLSMKTNRTQFISSMALKADKTDTYTKKEITDFLEPKASRTALNDGLDQKVDNQEFTLFKDITNVRLDDLENKVQVTVDDIEASIGVIQTKQTGFESDIQDVANAHELHSQLTQNTINDIEVILNSLQANKADKTTTDSQIAATQSLLQTQINTNRNTTNSELATHTNNIATNTNQTQINSNNIATNTNNINVNQVAAIQMMSVLATNINEKATVASLDALTTNINEKASVASVNSLSTELTTTKNELNKLIALINYWIMNGNLQLNAIIYGSDPIREKWDNIPAPDPGTQR